MFSWGFLTMFLTRAEYTDILRSVQLQRVKQLTKHWTPSLVDDVQAHRPRPATGEKHFWETGIFSGRKLKPKHFKHSHLIHIWVIDSVDKSYRRRLVRVRVWQFHVNLPKSPLVWACKVQRATQLVRMDNDLKLCARFPSYFREHRQSNHVVGHTNWRW